MVCLLIIVFINKEHKGIKKKKSDYNNESTLNRLVK